MFIRENKRFMSRFFNSCKKKSYSLTVHNFSTYRYCNRNVICSTSQNICGVNNNQICKYQVGKKNSPKKFYSIINNELFSIKKVVQSLYGIYWIFQNKSISLTIGSGKRKYVVYQVIEAQYYTNQAHICIIYIH